MNDLKLQRFLNKIAPKSKFLMRYVLTAAVLTTTLGAPQLAYANSILCYDATAFSLNRANPDTNLFFICNHDESNGIVTSSSIINTTSVILTSDGEVFFNPDTAGPSWTVLIDSGSTQTYRCAADDKSSFIANCLPALQGLSVGANPPVAPAWTLSFNSSLAPLGLSTTQTQDNMKMNTEASEPPPIPDIRCVGSDGIAFNLIANLSTGDGFLPATTHSVVNPCETEESFECVTSRKIKNSGEFVPITMSGQTECPTPLPASPANCYVVSKTESQFSITYYCPTPSI